MAGREYSREGKEGRGREGMLPRSLPVAIIGPAVGVVRGTGGPALPAPLGILGKALRNASGQELVAVYFKFNHLLQVAPLPRDASREEVVLNVDFPWCQKREKEERERKREREGRVRVSRGRSFARARAWVCVRSYRRKGRHPTHAGSSPSKAFSSKSSSSSISNKHTASGRCPGRPHSAQEGEEREREKEEMKRKEGVAHACQEEGILRVSVRGSEGVPGMWRFVTRLGTFSGSVHCLTPCISRHWTPCLRHALCEWNGTTTKEGYARSAHARHPAHQVPCQSSPHGSCGHSG